MYFVKDKVELNSGIDCLSCLIITQKFFGWFFFPSLIFDKVQKEESKMIRMDGESSCEEMQAVLFSLEQI